MCIYIYMYVYIYVYVYAYIYIYIYMCVCVCVRYEVESDMLYHDENRKKNTYKWMRKNLLVNISDAFRRNDLRYEISKISDRKYFISSSGWKL